MYAAKTLIISLAVVFLNPFWNHNVLATVPRDYYKLSTKLAVCSNFILQMIMRSSGWQTFEGESKTRRRRMRLQIVTLHAQLLTPFQSMLLSQ